MIFCVSQTGKNILSTISPSGTYRPEKRDPKIVGAGNQFVDINSTSSTSKLY